MSMGFRLWLWSRRQFVNALEVQFTSTTDSHIGFICMCKVKVSKINDVLQRFSKLPQLQLFIHKAWVAICVCVFYGLVNTNTNSCWLKHEHMFTRLRHCPDLRTNISEFHVLLCSCKIPTYSNVNYSNCLN